MEEHQRFQEFCKKHSWPTHEDEVLSVANDKFSQWISRFPEKEKEIILEMLNEFSYFSRESVTNSLKELTKILKSYFNVHNNALYTYIKKKNGKICSSVDYWIDYRIISKLAPEYFIDDLNSFPDDYWINVENVVIIDDCCNSGGSLDKYLKLCNKSFAGKNLYYIVICAMQDARDKIKRLAIDHSANIRLVAMEMQQKAFLHERIHNLCTAEEFADYSLTLEIPKSYSLGFSDSQSLMAFYNNTPNNTIGVFWFKTTMNEPIFTRREKAVPLWELKEKKKEREASNYQAGVARGKYE